MRRVSPIKHPRQWRGLSQPHRTRALSVCSRPSFASYTQGLELFCSATAKSKSIIIIAEYGIVRSRNIQHVADIGLRQRDKGRVAAHAVSSEWRETGRLGNDGVTLPRTKQNDHRRITRVTTSEYQHIQAWEPAQGSCSSDFVKLVKAWRAAKDATEVL